MYKKILSLVLAIVMMAGFAIPSYASENSNRLVIRFEEFRYVIDDYDLTTVYVEYSKVGLTEIATIKSKANDEVLEKITNRLDLSRSYRGNEAYVFSREASFGKTRVRLNIIVEMYRKGFFRQINAIRGTHLGISNSVAPTEIEDEFSDAWSEGNKFPTSKIHYAYSGTLVAGVDSSVSADVSAELLGSGFTAGATVGSTTYYRRPFSKTGKISVY